MVPEASLEQTEQGTRPASNGWFVLDVQDTCWFENERFGAYGVFESEEVRFDQVGIGVGVLQPARGHLLNAEALLDEQARGHASRSVPRAD